MFYSSYYKYINNLRIIFRPIHPLCGSFVIYHKTEKFSQRVVVTVPYVYGNSKYI